MGNLILEEERLLTHRLISFLIQSYSYSTAYISKFTCVWSTGKHVISTLSSVQGETAVYLISTAVWTDIWYFIVDCTFLDIAVVVFVIQDWNFWNNLWSEFLRRLLLSSPTTFVVYQTAVYHTLLLILSLSLNLAALLANLIAAYIQTLLPIQYISSVCYMSGCVV